MIWLILVNILAWILVYIIFTEEEKWMKILFTIILLGAIVYFLWAKPSFIFNNIQQSIIVNIICDVIGLLLIFPAIKDKEK